jgi:hypothetical protein
VQQIATAASVKIMAKRCMMYTSVGTMGWTFHLLSNPWQDKDGTAGAAFLFSLQQLGIVIPTQFPSRRLRIVDLDVWSGIL